MESSVLNPWLSSSSMAATFSRLGGTAGLPSTRPPTSIVPTRPSSPELNIPFLQPFLVDRRRRFVFVVRALTLVFRFFVVSTGAVFSTAPFARSAP